MYINGLLKHFPVILLFFSHFNYIIRRSSSIPSTCEMNVFIFVFVFCSFNEKDSALGKLTFISLNVNVFNSSYVACERIFQLQKCLKISWEIDWKSFIITFVHNLLIKKKEKLKREPCNFYSMHIAIMAFVFILRWIRELKKAVVCIIYIYIVLNTTSVQMTPVKLIFKLLNVVWHNSVLHFLNSIVLSNTFNDIIFSQFLRIWNKMKNVCCFNWLNLRFIVSGDFPF